MKKYLLFSALMALGAILVFFSVVGIACLYLTAPVVTTAPDCSMIQRQNGELWCMTPLRAEDDATITGKRDESMKQTYPADNEPVWKSKEL
jgi:hypothetical protein